MRRRSSGWGAIAIVTAIGLSCLAGARPIGMSHAYFAHLLGINLLMGYGLCNGPCRVAQKILAERYGVHSVRVAGCVVWGPEVWYADGYNHVAKRLIIQDQGKDVFAAAGDEAMQAYAERRR